MACHRHRPLGERRHFVEHCRVDDRDPTLGFGRGDDAGANPLAAHFEIGEHMATPLECREIAAGRTKRNRFWRMKAMAASHSPSFEAQDFAGNDLVAVQHDDPVNGANELRRAVAPAHASRDGQLLESGLHDSRQKPGCGLPRAGRPAE